MTLKSLIEKRPGNAPRFMREQLRFHTMNPWRLLQRFNYVSEQLEFDLARIRKTPSVHDKQIADHSLAAFIHEEAVAKNFTAFNGCISGKDLRVNIAQDHLR